LDVNGKIIDERNKSLQESFRTTSNEEAFTGLITFANSIQHARLQIFKFLQEGDPDIFKTYEADIEEANALNSNH
jgi:hypothetical protein